MYKHYSLIVSLIIWLAIIALPAQAAAGTGLTIVTENSARTHPEKIAYSTTSDGFEVQGAVRSRFHTGRIWGHVDVGLTDADGQILVVRAAKLRRIKHSNKTQYHVRFKTGLMT